MIDFDLLAEVITPKQFAKAIGATPSRTAGMFHCSNPAHENSDKKASLAIRYKDGRTVVYCHGCGLSGTPIRAATQLWGGSPNDVAERLAASAGITALVTRSNSDGPKIAATYEYTDESGEHLYEVVRYAHPKDFRQRVRQGKGWTWKLGNTRRVLYRLPEVVAKVKKKGIVMICEGEKDADALSALGFVATCNAGGAGKWRSGYSESLRGTPVVILPDNDQPGREHAQAVAQALHGKASKIRVLELPGLPDKGDISDWLQNGGTRGELERLVKDRQIWEPPTTVPEPEHTEDEAAETDSTQDVAEPDSTEDGTESFEWPDPILPDMAEPPPVPIDILPTMVARYIQALADSIRAEPEMGILPVLAAAGAALMGKIEIQVKQRYVETVNLFTAVVAESGEGKSPFLSAIFGPLWEREETERKRFEEQSIANDARRGLLESDEKRLKKEWGAKKDDDDKDKVEELYRGVVEELRSLDGKAPRRLTSDVTPERIAGLMAENDGRITLVSPEGGPFKIMAGQYSKASAIIDTYTKAWRGEPIRIDRQSGDPIIVDDPCLTMCIALQPIVLQKLPNKSLLKAEGLLPRFLFLCPRSVLGSRPATLETPGVSDDDRLPYEKLITRLLDLKVREEGKPDRLTLSPEAERIFTEFELWLEPQLGETGSLRAIHEWGVKLTANTLRMAALFHVLDRVDEGENHLSPISEEAMTEAVRLAKALIPHARYVERAMVNKLPGQVLAHIRGESSISRRELHRRCQGLAEIQKADDLDAPLERLEDLGCVQVVASSKTGLRGKPRSPTIYLNPKLQGTQKDIDKKDDPPPIAPSDPP